MPKILIAFLLGLFVIGCNSSDTSSAGDAPAEEATADAGDEFEAKGKRGNRQRDERPREPRANNNRGGRKGGKLVIDDNEFPAL